MGWYSSFLALREEKDTEENSILLKDRGFCMFLRDKVGDNVEMVKAMAPVIKSSVIKPQQLLFDHFDFYIAVDLYTSTYYICYKSLLMIDLDDSKTNVEEGLEKIRKSKERFLLFKSRGGYHAFLVSKRMDYRSDEAVKLSLDLCSDFYYVIYSYIRGWSVRLNPKVGEDQRPIYSNFGLFGEGREDPKLMSLALLQASLIVVFENVNPSTTGGSLK